MNFNNTSALDKTSCTEYVDFGKNVDRFGRISWSQIEKDNQNYLDIQLKVLRKDDKGDFRRHQQIKLGVFDFKQPLLLRNPIVQAVREFSTDETHKEVVTYPYRKIWMNSWNMLKRLSQLWIDPKGRSLLPWRNTAWINREARTCNSVFSRELVNMINFSS